MRNYKKFNWIDNAEKLRQLLYKKVRNHADLEVSFSPSEINPNYVLMGDDREDFVKWLIEERIAKSVKDGGANRLICIVTDAFMSEELSKEVFGQ